MIASVAGVALLSISKFHKPLACPLAGDLWQPEGLYKIPPDFQLLDEVATKDNSHKDAKDATDFQGSTTWQLSPQAPSSAFPIVDNAYDTIAEAPEKRREPDPSTPSYVNMDPPCSSPMLAATQPSKCRSPSKPPHSAKSPSVPQEDHIYTEVGKSHKTSASSTSLQEDAMGSAYTEVDYSKKKSRRGKKR